MTHLAGGGGTINVLPAAYDESVTLGDGITLQGDGALASGAACVPWSGLIRGKISLSGNSVAVRGLTLMPPIPSSAVIGVAAAADGLTIECNLIDAANTGSLSWGVETMSSAPVGDTKLRILSNTFRDIYGGVYLNSGAPSTTIHGNVFDRMILGGVSSDSDGSVVITHNVFRDGEDGVWIGHYHPDTVVRGNSFSGHRDEALDYDPAEPALNARQNWWGAASGPRTQALEHGEITPDQVIDGNIDTDPWCGDAGCPTAPIAVSGVVTDGGSAVSGAVVETVWAGGVAESAATDADGVYRLDADIPWSLAEIAVQARLGDRSSLPLALSVQDQARHEDVALTLTQQDISPTSPEHSHITADPAEAAAGGAPAVITVVAHNADGQRRTVGGDTVAIYTDFGDLSDVLDNGNGTYTARLSSQDIGVATLHGEINGTFLSSPASVAFVVGPPSATTTTITAAPAKIPADGVSQSVITVDLKAAGGSDIDTNGDEVVTLALTDESKGTLSQPVQGADGTWTALLGSSTQAGTSTITGTLDNGDGDGAQSLNSVAIVTHLPLAGDVARSTMTATPSASVAADNVTTSSVVVQVKDVHQNDRTIAGDTVDFKTTNGTFQNGLSTITVLSDANGRATALLKSAVTGAAEVTAKLNSVDMAAKSTVNFTTPPGTFSPFHSTLTGPAPANRPANGTAKARMTVQAKKSGNGTHTVAGLTVELRAEGPDATLSGDFLDAVMGTSLGNPVVLTTNASGQVSVDLVSTTVGAATVTGSIDGGVIGNNGGATPVVNFQALSDASTTTITASPLDANVGSTATVTLTARDGAGAQRGFGGEAVALGLAPSSVGSLTPVTDNGNGTYTATLSSADAGDATITGTIGGQPVTTASPVVRFHATLSGARSTIRSDEPAVVFGGERKAVVTVQLVGTDGLPRRHPSEPTLTVEKDQGVEVTPPVRDQDDLSIFRFEVSSKLPWPDGTRVRAKVGSTYVGQAPNDGVTIIFEPGTDAAKSSIARAAGESGQLRAGLDQAKIVVTTRNALGDDRRGGGDLVAPTIAPADAPVDVVVVDRHDGTYEFTVTATGSADVTVGATIDDGQDGQAVGGDEPTLAFRTPGAGAQSVISTNANPVDAASSSATITVAVKDDGGRNRNLGGDQVELWTEGGGSVAATQMVTISGSNTVQTTFTAPIHAGDVEIHGTVNSESLTPLVLTVRGGAAVAANSTLSAAPDKVVADGVDYALITATLKDTYGNDAKTACTTTNLSFYRTGSGSFSERSASANVCTIRLRATTAGTVVVKALYNSAQLANSSMATFEKPADADTTTITASPATVPADGTRESVITVQAVSEDGVARTFGGDVVTLTTDLGAFGNGSDAVQAVDNGDGTYTAALTSTSAGTANVSGTINDAEIAVPATVTFEATAPDAPPSVTATEDDGFSDVTWTEPASTGGVPLSHYVVTATPDGGEPKWVETADTQATIDGLTNGVSYVVTVQAVNEADEVSPATEASKQVVPFGDPQAPVPMIDRSSGAITLAWDPVDGNGRPISRYDVTAVPRAGGAAITEQAALGIDAGKVRHTFDALTKGVEYDFTIVARNAGGKESAPSDKLTQRFATKPAAPSGLKTTAGNGTVTVTWTAPDNGGEPVSTYRVTASSASAAPIVKHTGSPSASYDFTGLTNGTAYTFTVAATNELGSSDESGGVTATPVAPRQNTPTPGDGTTDPDPQPTVTASPTPTPTPTPTEAPAPLPGPGPIRINGEDRSSTAAAVSASHFDPGVPSVYIATASNYADALSGGPAAALDGGPILLVDRDRVPDSTAFELQRLQPQRVVVLGGTGAISELVAEELDEVAPVQRMSGADRFATAAAVSKATFPERVSVAYIATGSGFADALSGGAAAARNRGPVLLVGSDGIPAATAEELRRLSPRQIVVLGGNAAVPPELAADLDGYTDGLVERLSGPDRYATSAAIAQRMFPVAVDTVFVATGENFPDALAGVPAAAREKAPLLLVRGDGVPEAVAEQLERLRPRRIVILGGSGAVSAETERELGRYTVE